MSTLVFQATLGGQINLNGANTASSFDIAVPATTGTMVTTGDSGTVTNTMLAASAYNTPGTIGSGTANTGAFTTLSASSTVSGTGFSNYLASPPAIGGTAPAAGKFTGITNNGLTSGRVVYSTTGGLETDSANLLYSGTDLTVYGLTVGRGAGAVASNTAVGASALAANSTGVRNTAIGFSSASANSVNGQNTSVGWSSFFYGTGGYNTVIGDTAGYGALSVSTGEQNVFVGRGAGFKYTSSSFNTFVGDTTGYNTTSGANNTALGASALYSNTTASNNTAVGYQAGYGITTGSNNTYLGYQATQSGVAVTGEIVLCTGTTTGKGSNTGYINTSGGVYQGNNSAAWSITSDQRIKKNIVDNNTGLNIINQIQVRNFEYRLPEEITDVPQEQAIKKQGIQLGVIAQELQQILPECVKTESTGVMTVDADNLTWYLVNAVKELSAQVAQLQSQLKGN